MRFGRSSGILTAATALLAFGAASSAQAGGDAKLGEQKFYTCLGCHGIESYKNAYPDYSVPRLRHQQAAYIVSALQEYRNGDRPHATSRRPARRSTAASTVCAAANGARARDLTGAGVSRTVTSVARAYRRGGAPGRVGATPLVGG